MFLTTALAIAVSMPATIDVPTSPTVTVTRAAAQKPHDTNVQPFGKGSKVIAKTSSNHIYSTVTFPASVKKAELEKKVGNKWAKERDLYPQMSKGKNTTKFWVYLPKPGGTDTYRLRLRETASHSAKTTPTQQLHVPKANLKINTWYNPSKPVPAYRQAMLHGWVNDAKRPVELQKWTGKKWVTAATSRTQANGQYAIYTPKTTSTGTAKYRVNFPATATHNAAAAAPVSIKHENPRHYTGYKKTIYNHVKKWCPNITINTAKPNGKWDGLAHMGFNSISVVTGKSGNRLKHIALHECGHMLQDWAYKGDYQKLETRMNKIYGAKGSKGLEFNADCIAKAIGSPGPFSYNSNCKGARGSAASTIVKGKQP